MAERETETGKMTKGKRFVKDKDKSLPVLTVCRNCRTRTVGRYCHICGQDLLAGTSHKIRELLEDSFGTILAWDNNVFRTLWCLVAFPGRLTKEFYAGRIVRYVYPSKLFWFLSIIFFALFLSGINQDEPEGGNIKAAVEVVKGQEMTEAPEEESIFSDSGEILDFLGYMPYLVLVLVPVFALLIYTFFRRKEQYYFDYLVFSFHFNSFIFLFMSVMMVLWAAVGEMMGGYGKLVFGLAWTLVPSFYLGIALRRVFKPRVMPMILKITVVALLYAIAMLIVFIIAIIVFAYMIKKIDIFA